MMMVLIFLIVAFAYFLSFVSAEKSVPGGGSGFIDCVCACL